MEAEIGQPGQGVVSGRAIFLTNQSVDLVPAAASSRCLAGLGSR
jgi:hypothetical protein